MKDPGEAYATLIRGGSLVVPVGDGRVRAMTGDLLLRGGRIEAVGPVDAPPSGTRVIYASGCAVLPGLVQTHVHLAQSLCRGEGAGLPSTDRWHRRIAPLEAAHTPESIRASVRLAVAELLLGGTTAVQGMEPAAHAGTVLEVLAEAGMFAVVGPGIVDDRAAPEALVEPTEKALRRAVDLAESWEGRGDGRLAVGLAPRSTTSCTDACLREVATLAETAGWRVQTQAAETREEVLRIQRRAGRRSVEYLDDVGLLGPRVGLAHCIWVEDREADLLAATATRVLHCPGSDGKLGAGIAPVPRLLDKGVAVSLGADGAACNDTLDAFREARLAAILQTAIHGPGSMPPEVVLDMLTRRGAAALGREDELGVLAPGAVANVVLVDLEGTHSTPSEDVLATLLYNVGTRDVRSVWLGGRQVVAEGRLMLWDEEDVRREARRQRRGLLERAGLD